MATKKKTVNGINDAFIGGMHLINNLWQNVGGEFDKALKTARHQGKKSAQALRETVDGVRTQIKSVESAIEEGIDRIQDLEVVEYAKVKMNDTREQVLSALQIPSNTELEQLTHKITILEKKLNALRKPEARQ